VGGHAGRRRGQLDPELADHELSRRLAPLPGRAVHGRRALLPRRYPGFRQPSSRQCPPLAEKRAGPAASTDGRAQPRRPPREMTGPTPRPGVAETVPRTGAIIYLESVTVDYDGFLALNNFNFYMDRRELRVVIGPNGAGKTTLLDVISGRTKPGHG